VPVLWPSQGHTACALAGHLSLQAQLYIRARYTDVDFASDWKLLLVIAVTLLDMATGCVGTVQRFNCSTVTGILCDRVDLWGVVMIQSAWQQILMEYRNFSVGSSAAVL
jgi:hypothetical protein